MAPRTLLYDLENSPSLGWVWGKWQQDVIAFEDDWHILSVAYKWLGESKIHVAALPDYPLYKRDPDNDREVVKLLHRLFSEADIVVAHNGDRFDQRKSQARMLIHGLEPPAPYRQVDTLKVARKHFAFTSNKLGELCTQLGIGAKVPTTGFHLWRGCMAGDPKSWATMKRYNRQDVVLLEDLYLRLRPWVDNHPTAGLYGTGDECPKCGVAGRMQRRGHRVNRATVQVRLQCQACRGYSVAGPRGVALPT